MKIIAISGSLRKDSYNTALLHAAKEVMPEGMEIDIVDIASLPMYSQDAEAAYPTQAQALKDAVEGADGIIMATPEHNRSIPSALKNALDWLSRPYGKNSFPGKPVLVLGASIGPIATAVAQYHLKQILTYLNADVIGQPEFYLGAAGEKFDDEGKLTDEKTRELLAGALETLAGRVAHVS